MPTTKTITPAEIPAVLKARRHTYRTAATLIGVHHTHILRVAQGKRQSKSLLRRIAKLPTRKAGNA